MIVSMRSLTPFLRHGFQPSKHEEPEELRDVTGRQGGEPLSTSFNDGLPKGDFVRS